MSRRETALFWLAGGALLLMFLLAVKSVLFPFVVALIMAYLLDPAADKLEHIGLSRSVSTLCITILLFLVLVGIILLLGPLLYNQLLAFLKKVPAYIQFFSDEILPLISDTIRTVDPAAVEQAKSAMSDSSGKMAGFIGKFIGNLWDSGIAVINILSLFFITPIVTFYILRDWDRLIAKANGLLPPKYANVIRQQAYEIDRTLAGYIRGQTYVCLLLGAFYAIGLSIIGLEFGLIIGMVTGILCFIPYVGMLFGLATALLIGFFQFEGDLIQLAVIAGIFLAGQVIEGNFITPKLVGEEVNLHPVWLIFGMLCGGALFGFTGILLAVPITAIIGVLVRFGVSRYMHSELYQQRQ